MKVELRSLTGFRMIAAFYVFLFHVHIRWPISANKFLDNVLSQGALGMTMFFMLSGYILAYRYDEDELDMPRFFRSRFARIYPIYALAALITLPWLISDLSPLSWAGFGGIFIMAIQLFVALFTGVFMLQAWFPQLFSYWNNGASWSLSAEAFFYITFPLAYKALRTLNPRMLIGFLLFTYVVSLLPELAYRALEPRPSMALQTFYAMPIFRLPEFLVGICVYLLQTRSPLFGTVASRSMLSALVLLFLYLAVIGNAFSFYTGHNIVAIPVLALVISGLAQGQGVLAKLLGSRTFVWGGKISYCFYSFQFFVLFCALYLDSIYSIGDTKLVISMLIVLVVMSHLGYRYVEEPCRRWIHSLTPKTLYANRA